MYKALFQRGSMLLTWCSPGRWKAEEGLTERWSWGVMLRRDWRYLRLLGVELSWVK